MGNVRVELREEPLTDCFVLGAALVTPVVPDLALEECPGPLDDIEVRRVGRYALNIDPRLLEIGPHDS